MSDLRAAPEPPEPLAGWRWWTGLAVGGAVGLAGLAGLLRDAAKTMPLVWLGWLVGLLLVHDFVLAPLIHLTGRRLRDRAPASWRWPLQLGLVTSGALVLASVPVLVGVGRRTQPGNASVLPGNYPLALAGVLTVVWLGVLALGIRGSTRRRRQNQSPGHRPPVAERVARVGSHQVRHGAASSANDGHPGVSYEHPHQSPPLKCEEEGQPPM